MQLKGRDLDALRRTDGVFMIPDELGMHVLG
jgi:hypothetical protein